jgi:hypothetical protein
MFVAQFYYFINDDRVFMNAFEIDKFKLTFCYQYLYITFALLGASNENVKF